MPDHVTNVNVVPVNDGVTTCLLAFLFACLILPSLVRNKTQYYAALAFVIAIVLLHALGLMIKTAGFQVFAGAMTGLLQAGAILLVVLCVGGLRIRELAGDLKDAYEVIRRGQQEKEVIIPLRGGGAGGGAAAAAGAKAYRPQPADAPPVYRIDPETGEDVIVREGDVPATPVVPVDPNKPS
jgi:hypothetical protein